MPLLIHLSSLALQPACLLLPPLRSRDAGVSGKMVLRPAAFVFNWHNFVCLLGMGDMVTWHVYIILNVSICVYMDSRVFVCAHTQGSVADSVLYLIL